MEQQNKNPNGLLGFISFIFPFIGIILGAVFVCKDSSKDKETGGVCFKWAFVSIIIGLIIIIGNL